MQFYEEDVPEKDVSKMMGPGAVDTQLREAIRWCWMTLPADKKTVLDVQTEIRRLVERALKDLEEDAKAFGIG